MRRPIKGLMAEEDKGGTVAQGRVQREVDVLFSSNIGRTNFQL